MLCVINSFIVFSQNNFEQRKEPLLNFLRDAKIFDAGLIYHNIYPLGFDKNELFFAFFDTIVSPGKGDKAYKLVIFDIKNNKLIEETSRRFIADYYDGPGGMIDGDWNDPKYSVDSFYSFEKRLIDSVLEKYRIVISNISFSPICNSSFLINNRSNIDGLNENITYKLNFSFQNKSYEYTKIEEYITRIKKAVVIAGINLNNSIIVIFARNHAGFGGNDYFDFIPISFNRS
jgi:hypothetical protein